MALEPMESVFPIRAIIFQCLFLLVAIALEASVLRQKLRLGYRTSIEYATTINLLSASLGWFTFLALEPLLPPELRTQILSFVLFDQFFINPEQNIGLFFIAAGFLTFFLTFGVKLQGLDWLQRILDAKTETKEKPAATRQERYQRARRGGLGFEAPSQQSIAVLQANALSFSAIFLLLLLQAVFEIN
ncbi:filament integrity protein FraC [Sphaerothrix gracilis]|uniref:filament integrity protein FraC n=1 Tax=Sphaerothrix gracilis TaxID=3151835 RepID=UPI0031FBBC08